MAIRYRNTSPHEDDSINTLLGKILQLLGSFAEPNDSTTDLLNRLLALIAAAGGGGGGGIGPVVFASDVTINNGDLDLTDGKIHVVDNGVANAPPAIWSEALNSRGLQVRSQNNYGVYAESIAGIAVYANGATCGVFGVDSTGTFDGVKGLSAHGDGVHGETTDGYGVYGVATGGGIGVQGVCVAGTGVYGTGADGVYGVGTVNGAEFYSAAGNACSVATATGTAFKGVVTGAATALMTLWNNLTQVLKVTINGLIECAGVVPTPVTLTPAAGHVATDAALGTHFRFTLAGDLTLDVPTNPTDGQRIVWEMTQDGAGSHVLTLAGGAGGFALGADISAVVLTTTASKTDFMTTIYNSTANKHYVVAFVKGY